MNEFLLTYGWLIWSAALLAGPLLAGAVLGRGADRDEYDADRRRLVGGTIWTDIVWEIKGEEERSVTRLTELLAGAADDAQRQKLAEELQARFRQQERLGRLLRFKDGAS